MPCVDSPGLCLYVSSEISGHVSFGKTRVAHLACKQTTKVQYCQEQTGFFFFFGSFHLKSQGKKRIAQLSHYGESIEFKSSFRRFRFIAERIIIDGFAVSKTSFMDLTSKALNSQLVNLTSRHLSLTKVKRGKRKCALQL